MAATSITTPSEVLPGIAIGLRLRAELERRVRERAASSLPRATCANWRN
jgi:hypothetical protein